MSLTEREQQCLDRYADELRRTDKPLYLALAGMHRVRTTWQTRILLYLTMCAITLLVAAVTGIPVLPVVAWLAMAGIGAISVHLAT